MLIDNILILGVVVVFGLMLLKFYG